VRKQCAAADGQVGDLDRAGFGFCDVETSTVGTAIGDIGAEESATEIHSQRRLPLPIEEPHRTQHRMGDGKPTLDVHRDAVRSSAPAQLDEVQHAGQAPVREYGDLDDSVRPSQSHIELYKKFAKEWTAYQGIAATVLELARTGRKSEGVVVYMTTSRRAFGLASDTLVQLTDQTVEKARAASERAATTYEHARRLIVIAMVLASALLISGIIYITRSILTPTLDLARRMHALAEQDMEIVIPGSDRDDETDQMARSVAGFRDNALALMQSQRRLLEQAATLDEALENEQRLTVKQRNFVSMTSLEFRTPLTIIDGQAQRLIKMCDRLDPQGIAERAGRIRSAVLRMTSIMDSL
jgi:two-component system OmpR family sensor kinase